MRRRVLIVMCFLCFGVPLNSASAAERFGRKILAVADESLYRIETIDEVDVPVLDIDGVSVSCLVYRGTQRYYVEVSIKNGKASGIEWSNDDIVMIKPGYSIFRVNALDAARESAEYAGVPFVPAPPPEPVTTTTIQTHTSVYGNSAYSTGTAQTRQTQDAGANIGYALGTFLARRRDAKDKAEAARFADFIGNHAIEVAPAYAEPGQTRIIVAAFEQAKPRHAPFHVKVVADGHEFSFEYKE